MTDYGSRAGRLLTHLVLLSVTVATLYPLLLVLCIAVSPGQGFDADLSPIPDAVTFDNFRAVIGERTADGEWLFGRQLLNSSVIAVAKPSKLEVRSSAVPPSSLAAPCMPCSVSAPVPPSRWSLPVPPLRKSAPASPNR